MVHSSNYNKLTRYFRGQRKYFTLTALFTFLLILSGLLEPVFMDSLEKNWKEKRDREISAITIDIETFFASLESNFSDIFIQLTAEHNPSENNYPHTLNKDEVYFVVDVSDNLVYWSEKYSEGFRELNYKAFSENEVFFFESGLVSYLATYQTKDGYTSFLLKEIDKHYVLGNNYYLSRNIEAGFEQKYDIEFSINYSPVKLQERDGRYYSFEITNAQEKTIGFVDFQKPPRRQALINLSETISLAQALFIIAAFIFLVIGILQDIRSIKSHFIKFILYFAIISVLRFLLLFFNIPTSFLEGELTKVEYFSSVFAFGLVKSPLEFVISVFFLLSAIFTGYYYFLRNVRDSEIKNSFNLLVKIGISVGTLFLFLLGFRGVAASIKSVIFDSSFRYFVDASLRPEIPTLIMELGILMLGLCLIWMSVVFVGYLIVLWTKNRNRYTVAILFVVIHIAGYLFDIFQNEPQATPTIRTAFITLIFILAYVHVNVNPYFSKNLIYSLFLSSIVAISVLIYYNSELERESIKTTAQEITRPNEYYIEFVIRETLNEVFYDDQFVTQIRLDQNNDKAAFKVWSNSSLQKETFPGYFALIDSDAETIGEFSYNFDKKYIPKFKPEALDTLDELKVFKESIFDSNLKIINGLVPVKFEAQVVAYFLVSVIYDVNSFGFHNMPEFLSSVNSNFGSPIDITKLKIFNFHDDELVKEYTEVKLTKEETATILSPDFTKYNEKWLKMDINDEEHIVYVMLDLSEDYTRKLAVALKLKDTTWSLFDFFKVFFVHTIFIVLLLIIVFLLQVKSAERNLFNFRTQLLAAFLIIAIIPLMFLATYLRNLTEEKNNEAIIYKLNKRAVRVERFLDNYLHKTSLSGDMVYEKALNDLNINFSLYKGKDLVYSSKQNYINIGLLSDVISFSAHSKITNSGLKEVVTRESIENYQFNALYYKAEIGGEEYVVRVDDVFNNILLPFAGVEVDIFIFGSYSLAVIFIIIISSILSNQIASPIRKLTFATKAVASGDLSLQVGIKSRGEIKDLVDGFNYMTKKLKQNQSDLALLEREAAWKQMARQVAHEIKNPLTPMKLAVQQMIASFTEKPEKFNEMFGKVSRMLINQIDILTNIASEFHAFARMPKLNLKMMELNQVVREVAYIFAQEKVRITTQSNKDLIQLNSDKDQLKRTLVNLIRNAIQAQSKNIIIELKQFEETTELRIKDDGNGVKPEMINKIFEENFTTKSQGMGLGLSMAKKFVESLNGTIKIESSSELGTVFLMVFPNNGELK